MYHQSLPKNRPTRHQQGITLQNKEKYIHSTFDDKCIAFKLQSIIKALFIYRKISVCLLDWPDGIAHHSKTDYM